MSLLIGLCGRTGSGKTTAAKLIKRHIEAQGKRVGVISMDDCYRELSEQDHQLALKNEYNFDCMESFDLGLLRDMICSARKGEMIRHRPYDHAHHKHSGEWVEMGPFDVVVFEGLYLFADPICVDLFDLKIFMDIEADESLIRRIRRDIVKRRRTVEDVLAQYQRYVKPAYEKLVKATRKHANILIPRGAHNKPAMQSVCSYIDAQLN